jgi:L-asparaginase
VVLGTGGTIAGTAASTGDHLGYQAAQLGVEHLIGAIASLRGKALVAEQVAQVDSKDMTHEVWLALATRCAHWLAKDDVSGIVVTHGTDTLEETAFFLQEVLAPSKPIVLTCAMRPATALVPDGPQNVADAVVVAECEGAQGVVVVCAGAIHAARDVAKVHPYRLDAFASGDAGPLGWIEAGRVRRLREWPAASGERASLLPKLAAQAPWPRVQIVMSHAGADSSLVDALVASGAAGLVVAGTGNGTVHDALEAGLLRAQNGGVRILRSTRCAQGQVLAQAGDALESTPLSPVKARIALMLDLLA